MAKRAGMVTELDEALMVWLEGHHIRPKDVRAWGTEAKVNDVTILTLEVIVSGVDEIGHSQKCGRPLGHTGECWPLGGTHPVPSGTTLWPARGEPGHIAPERIDLTGWSEAEIEELDRTGVPPESRR